MNSKEIFNTIFTENFNGAVTADPSMFAWYDGTTFTMNLVIKKVLLSIHDGSYPYSSKQYNEILRKTCMQVGCHTSLGSIANNVS